MCDMILSNLTIDTSCKEVIDIEIPEIHKPLIEFTRHYLQTIEEFNYFGTISKLSFTVKNMQLRYIPPWQYQMYEQGGGGHFNFYVFLADTNSVFEVFNPFIRGCFRVRPRKGLVVIFPAMWMLLSRHTDTFDTNSIFICGALSVNNFNYMEDS